MKLTLTDARNAAGRYCLPKRLSAVLLLILLILGLISCGRSEGTGETSDTVTDKISETGGEDKVNISESAKKEWVLASSRAEMRIRADDTGFSVESLCALEDKYDWISAAVKETALVSSVIDEETGSTVNLNWRYEKGVLEEWPEHLSLTLYFCDSNSMLTYTARFRCLKKSETFEVCGAYANNSARNARINISSVFALSFSADEPIKAWTFKKQSGEAEGYNQFPGSGHYITDFSDGMTEVRVETNVNQDWGGNGYIPIVYYTLGDLRGLYTAVEWSSCAIYARQEGDVINERVALSPSRTFSTVLAANGNLEIPTVYIGIYNGDIEIGSNQFKRWFFENKSPASLKEDPEEPLTQMAMQQPLGTMSDMGVQSVQWDYGWWAEDGFAEYEGSWELRSQAVRNDLMTYYSCLTMEKFGKLVTRSYNMNFTVYALLHDTQDRNGRPTADAGEFNSIQHPDWFCNRRIAEKMGRSADLGNEECVNYLKTAMSDFFNKNHIGTWRSDFEPICRSSDLKNRHDANGTDVQYWCSVGFYDLLGYLHENVKPFRYECCSSGGSLKDYATLKYATVINCEDSYNYLSLRMNFYDTSYCIPPAQIQLNCSMEPFCRESKWFYLPGKVNMEESELTSAAKDYGMRSILIGVPYITNSTPLDENGRLAFGMNDYISRYFNLYNEKIKPLVKYGDLYHILPRPNGEDWDGVMYSDADSQNEIKGAVFLFKPSSAEGMTKTVILRGLDEETSYSVCFEDRTEQNTVMTGKELMTYGLTVNISEDLGSEIIWIIA